MSIPLEELTLYEDNKYAMATAVIKRAKNLADGYPVQAENLDEDKIVSVAMNEILTGIVHFTEKDEE